MANDKYKEFKKWVSKKAMNCETMELSSLAMDLLIEFETEQNEKEKEREIKKTIKEALKEQRCSTYSIDGYVYVVYKALKEKDLIK